MSTALKNSDPNANPCHQRRNVIDLCESPVIKGNQEQHGRSTSQVAYPTVEVIDYTSSRRSSFRKRAPLATTLFTSKGTVSSDIQNDEETLLPVEGKCDRCKGFKTIPCEIDDSNPKCKSCQRYPVRCYWNGISRLGARRGSAAVVHRKSSRKSSGKVVFVGKPPSHIEGSRVCNVDADSEPPRKRLRVRSQLDSPSSVHAMKAAVVTEIAYAKARVDLAKEQLARLYEKYDALLTEERGSCVDVERNGQDDEDGEYAPGEDDNEDEDY